MSGEYPEDYCMLALFISTTCSVLETAFSKCKKQFLCEVSTLWFTKSWIVHTCAYTYTNRSVPLIRPLFVHYMYIQPKEGRGRIFEYAISLEYTPPQKLLLCLWHCQGHSYKSTNDRQYCLWSSCTVSLHRREELPLQLEGHNIHDAFAVAIVKSSNTTVGHEPPGISCGRVAARWLVPSASTVTTRSAWETICKVAQV